MNRDIKYIGMDAHKEATVIAVLNGSRKLVMESIVKTKASGILQLIHGLRGEDRARAHRNARPTFKGSAVRPIRRSRVLRS